ncbi:hypothetical protein G9A89_000943 [Geosiphon pyriformis]|nr:hypothetical protein G9A89_000943 [Geosiphon pyriformis]
MDGENENAGVAAVVAIEIIEVDIEGEIVDVGAFILEEHQVESNEFLLDDEVCYDDYNDDDNDDANEKGVAESAREKLLKNFFLQMEVRKAILFIDLGLVVQISCVEIEMIIFILDPDYTTASQ